MASGAMVETIAMCRRARLKMTLSRFSPPRWLIGPKFITIRPSAPGRIAHAHQDDVAFVALNVLEVLDEQAVELAIILTCIFAFSAARKPNLPPPGDQAPSSISLC